jgi:DNA-binding response OmpR family regulator
MQILVVEDDDLVGSAIQRSLMRAGYAVDWARTGEDVVAAMQSQEYDGVLLDLGLPDMQGETLLKGIRARSPGMPVIVITARGGVQDRISLLDIGADDYMTKPVDLDELAARLRAVLRRVSAAPEVLDETEHGPLKLFPSRRCATWHGNVVPLTNKEYWLLETLVRKKSLVVTRAQLEEALYGWGEEVGSNAVEVYIHYLRRKFGTGLIRTVRGVGYQLGPPHGLEQPG